jgi:hypothetical protein
MDEKITLRVAKVGDSPGIDELIAQLGYWRDPPSGR